MTGERRGRTFVLSKSRTIPLSIGPLFAYAADFANLAEWDPGVARSTKLSPGEPRSGTRYELLGNFGPAKIAMTYEVTEWEPPRRAVLVSHEKSFDSADTLEFDSVGDEATRLTYTASITIYSFLRFFGPPTRWFLDRMGERAMDGLVAALRR